MSDETPAPRPDDADVPGDQSADVTSTEVARTGDGAGAETSVAPATTHTPDRFTDPGLPPHIPRHSDVDPKAAKRAERQVAALFTLSIIGTIAFLVTYFVVPFDPMGNKVWIVGIGDMDAHHLALSLSLTVSLLGIGLGAVHWGKTLMSDAEVVEQRKPQVSDEETQQAAAQILRDGYQSAQLHRRPVLLWTAGGALGLFALPLGLQVIGGLGPLPEDTLEHTNWEEGKLLRLDPSGRRIRPEHVGYGSVFHVMPDGFVGYEAEHEISARELHYAKATDSVILVRLHPDEIKNEKQKDWGIDGIVAYSKICTHVGCPVALYEQQTHHLLCPCHQSTFDMTDDCKVIFGPAKRALPQLPIRVNADGYIEARSGFHEAVGPSFWERG